MVAGSRPNASATVSAPDLFRTPSLRNSRVWTFSTVFGAMPSARAVCRIECPLARDRRMSVSRDVRSGSPPVPGTGSSHLACTTPISGRIGPSQVTQGAYVQASAATLMATIQQIERGEIDQAALQAFTLMLDQARSAIADRRIVLLASPAQA